MPRSTPFVGREAAIKTLRQVSAQAGAGHGQVVAMAGEAGVGKSRLMHEFVHRYQVQGWRVLEMVAAPSGSMIPYLPVKTLLKRYGHIAAIDEPATIRTKLTEQIINLDEVLQETLPALFSLLDVLTDDSPFRQLELFEQRHWVHDALVRLVLRESQVQPLLLVVDNLQWVDSQTQAFLDRLVESLSTAQILLWVSYRSLDQLGWKDKPYYTDLPLTPLPSASAAECLQHLLGDNPDLDALKHLLIERAAGHPLFLEESIQRLMETHMLVGQLGSYRLSQQPSGIELPTTLEALLAARLDQLSPEDKRLLQTAAVIGTEVPLRLLQVVAELPETVLYSRLLHLQAAAFLDETHRDAEYLYTFTHTLAHDVIYGSLRPEQRQALHMQIATAMKTLDRDLPVEQTSEQIERRAYHAFQGELWDEAFIYYQKAGTSAKQHASYREAMWCWQQALAAWRHLPRHRPLLEQGFELLCDLQEATNNTGATEQGIVYLEEAEILAKSLGDPHRLGQVSAFLLHKLRWLGEYERASENGQRALTLLTPGEHDLLRSTVNADLGQLYHMIGQYQQAQDYFQQNVAIFKGALRHTMSGLTLGSVGARMWTALCMAELGAFAEGIAWSQEAIDLAKNADNLISLVLAQYGLGRVYLHQGEISQAMSLLDPALAHCRAAQVPLWTFQLAVHLGLAHALEGRVAEATQLLEEANSIPISVASMGTKLSEAYLLTGRSEEALELATSTLELSRTQKTLGMQATTLHLLGDIYNHRQDFPQAEAHYQQALTLAETLGMRPLQAHCHFGHGRLYRQTGQMTQARAKLSIASQQYQTLGMTLWLPQAEAALAEMEGAQDTSSG